MKTFAALFVMCTILTVGFAAPTRKQQAAVQDFLAEIEEANARQEKMATIEQTFKALLKSYLNNTLNYMRNKFVKPGTSIQYVLPYSEPSQWAQIEQTTWRELLGGVLKSANNYAQHKLSSPWEREVARIEQDTFKELLGNIFKDTNDYAQRKLSMPLEREIVGIQEAAEVEGVGRGTEEEADEQVLSAILPLITKLLPIIISNFGQSDQGDSAGGGGFGGFGNFWTDVNK